MADNPFLKAILDNPDDDHPRLVYADYLEERGNVRGKFIRLQCELATAGPCRGWPLAPCDIDGDGPLCPVCRLIQPEQELLTAHRFAWAGAPLWPAAIDAVGPFSWRFHRGFIESINCTGADWLRHADQLTALHPLRTVILTAPINADEIDEYYRVGPRFSENRPNVGTLLTEWLQREWRQITFNFAYQQFETDWTVRRALYRATPALLEWPFIVTRPMSH